MRRKPADDDVTEAMAAISRVEFLPAEVQHLAAEDVALPLGYGQTNSQPHTVANMLRLLAAEPGHRVLDVGAGSGWTSALLGHIVGDTGQVLGVEVVPELAQQAADTVGRHSMSWVQIRPADATVLGAPDRAPFDRILVSAEADELPRRLTRQLEQAGVLVVPVRGEMLRVLNHGGDLEVSRHGPYRFVPLI